MPAARRLCRDRMQHREPRIRGKKVVARHVETSSQLKFLPDENAVEPHIRRILQQGAAREKKNGGQKRKDRQRLDFISCRDMATTDGRPRHRTSDRCPNRLRPAQQRMEAVQALEAGEEGGGGIRPGSPLAGASMWRRVRRQHRAAVLGGPLGRAQVRHELEVPAGGEPRVAVQAQEEALASVEPLRLGPGVRGPAARRCGREAKARSAAQGGRGRRREAEGGTSKPEHFCERSGTTSLGRLSLVAHPDVQTRWTGSLAEQREQRVRALGIRV
mmetsp:Transcript_30005/g.99375  ORF Transcript_30005/g.99375 Transcript_30005/m.99375 type:complete len:273 (+) Transcript_30005:266-1084(+)